MADGGTSGDPVTERYGHGGRRAYLGLLAAGTASALAGCGFGTGEAEPAVPKLAPEDGDAGDRFGASVALDGDRALLGAPGSDGPAGRDVGAAYVFARTDGGWSRQATMTSGSAGAGDRFGASVALDGDTVLVGAPDASETRDEAEEADEGGPDVEDTGAAYVFARIDGGWRREATLSPDPGAGVHFGASVALDGDRALVGLRGDTDLRFGSAVAAYAFVREGEEWRQEATLAPDDRRGDGLGTAVALDGDRAVVGDLQDDSFGGLRVGAAYAFSRADDTWSQEARLDREDPGGFGEYGSSVALSGDRAFVGAPREETADDERTGAAYAFSRAGGEWRREAVRLPDDADPDDRFGASVALAGDAALVGAPGEERPNGDLAGAAYVFARADGEWTREATLAPADGEFLDRFGVSAALSGDRALVGSADDDPNGEAGGAAYVYDV